MKALLACLLCFVFLESQAFALHQSSGGIGSIDTVIGTYSGVLVPTSTSSTDTSLSSSGTVTSGTTSTSSTSSNSIGIFSLGIPDTGLASGAFLTFTGGRVFTGTIQGIADPDEATLQAVLQGTFTFTIQVITSGTSTTGTTGTTGTSSTLTTSSVDITATATGNLNATITATDNLASATLTPSLGRLTGTAHLDVNFGTVDPTTLQPVIDSSLDFVVDGFKQSDTVTTTTTLGGGAGGTTGGA